MLVNFIGCPLSGKTTIAAAVFAALKTDGYPTEFVSERARFHIACRRVAFGPAFKLTDEDQFNIFKDQFIHEDTFKRASSESVVLADAAPLLALLYMSEEGVKRFTSEQEDLLKKATSNMEVVLHCNPVSDIDVIDPNRLHTHEQNLQIHARIPELLAKYAPHVEPILLNEARPHARTTSALKAIFTRMVNE
jgi:predicted ATPase